MTTYYPLSVSKIQKIFSRAVSTEVVLSPHSSELSVLMPFYLAHSIGWVAFESLIRQTGITFGWELIVIEENFVEPMGIDEILKYSSSLKEVGCCKITYIALDSWIPLSAKWYYLAQTADANSKVFALHSADGYSAPQRLASQYKILTGGKYNWYKLSGNIVYDIETDTHVKFFSGDKGRKDTHSRATIPEVMKRLPLVSIATSVDGWMHNVSESCLVNYFGHSDMWKYTVNINGLNTISFKRSKRIKERKPPLYSCCSDMRNHLPEEVVLRLQACSELAKTRRVAREKGGCDASPTVAPMYNKSPKFKSTRRSHRRKNNVV